MLEPKFNSTRSKNKPKSKIKIQHTLILITLCFAFENCAGYLWHLGTGQLDILLRRRSIRSILQDANTKKELKIKLQQVETFREYGIKELGLNPSSGFKSFVELDRKEIGWHVAACYPLKLESYTWWFPIAGTVPYKGYFDLEKAKEEENKLKEIRIFLVETASRLQTLYATDKNDSEKLKGKKRILEEFKSSLLTAKGKFKTIHTEKLASKNWNNEDFVGYLRYHSGSDFFRKEFEKTDRNFTQFHDRMRSLIDLSNEERKKLLETDPLKNE